MTGAAARSQRVHEVRGSKRMAIGVLSRLVRCLQASYRYENTAIVDEVFHPDHPGCLILMWHNRILPAIGLFNSFGRQSRRLHALSSASRDGATISYFLAKQGITPVRGSSSRRGTAAARELGKILQAGNHVAITLDGPRGPVYRAQPGAAFLMQLTGAPVYFLGVEADSCWELNSWDRFIIPKPFSRVKILADTLQVSDRADRAAQRDSLEEQVQEKMSALTLDIHRGP